MGPGSSAARTPPCRTMRSRPASGVPRRARAAVVVSSEALNLCVPLARGAVQVDMQAILGHLRFRLRYAIEEQPPPQSRAALRVVRVAGVPYRRRVPPGAPVVVADDDHLGRDGAEVEELADEGAVVLDLVAERGGPEVGLGVRVVGVDDELPVPGS